MAIWRPWEETALGSRGPGNLGAHCGLAKLNCCKTWGMDRCFLSIYILRYIQYLSHITYIHIMISISMYCVYIYIYIHNMICKYVSIVICIILYPWILKPAWLSDDQLLVGAVHQQELVSREAFRLATAHDLPTPAVGHREKRDASNTCGAGRST